jgi:transposase InsO family protein
MMRKKFSVLAPLEKLKEWEDFYNHSRPHTALGGQTPYERFREKAGLAV